MKRPNILFLMTDQMQGRVLDPEHPCQTPNFDRLAARGVRIRNAYTPNAVCSPARASLMTGLLPHAHGMLTVTHCIHDHTCQFQDEKPHWAQSLTAAGYRTGYFGKWHVERTNNLERFGWQTSAESGSGMFQDRVASSKDGQQEPPAQNVERTIDGPVEGYPPRQLFSVLDQDPSQRHVGVVTSLAGEFLDEVLDGDQPWCCFASCIEPHDPFVVGREAFEKYDVDKIPVPENWRDDLSDRPGLYRKAARAFADLTEREKREAAACYYGMITEIDQMYQQLIDKVERAGQIDNTIVVLTSDHGEFLGAHGLYMKNVSAFEEAYQIPMVIAGPGITRDKTTNARVGLHDLCPTLLALCGVKPFDTNNQSRSFQALLRNPEDAAPNFTAGYAEYFGTRYWYSQRVVWDGPWKLVWNGFDFDELYNLEEDPGEMENRIEDPTCTEQVRKLMAQAWTIIRESDDHPLWAANYPTLRLAPYGPGIVEG